MESVSKCNKREQIQKAALHLFTNQGFHATPTAQISKEAGVSTGTLFHYYPDKNALIDQLYITIKKEIHEAIRNCDDESLPIKLLLENGFIRYIHWGMQNPEKVQFIEQFHNSPNISEAIHTKAYEEFKWMNEYYEIAIRERILSDQPIQYHKVMIYQILNGILKLIKNEKNISSAEEIISAGLEKIWR